MKQATIPLAKGTNLWKAWIGFNGSHSAGAIFFGAINIYLVINFFSIYESAYFLHFLNLSLLFFFLFLAKKYWFSTPFNGILVASICFIIASIMLLF